MTFFIILAIFITSCGVDNTTATKWDGCVKDENCEAGLNCVAGNCVKAESCTDNNSCLNGQFCNEAGLCEVFCESDDNCGVGFVCDSESKKCEKDENIKLCEANSDCLDGQVCKDYECIDDNQPNTCESDLNCLNGQHCSSGTCIANCTENSCEEGYKCNEDTKECESASCQTNSDCDEGFYCEDETCKTKEYECTSNNDCFQGYECKDNKCEEINTNECDVASDCPGEPEIDCMGAHWECKNHECVAACGEGRYCGDDICNVELGENSDNCFTDCGIIIECVLDMFEPNDRRWDAVRVETGEYSLTLCEDDIDWFSIQMNTYTSLSVKTDMGNKMELYLRGTPDPIAISAIAADGMEVLTYDNNNSDARSIDVLLKVFRNDITIDNSSYDYNLNIQLSYIN